MHHSGKLTRLRRSALAIPTTSLICLTLLLPSTVGAQTTSGTEGDDGPPRLILDLVKLSPAPGCEGTEAQCLRLREVLYHYADMQAVVDAFTSELDEYYGVRLSGAIAIAGARARIIASERGGLGFWDIAAWVGIGILAVAASAFTGYVLGRLND